MKFSMDLHVSDLSITENEVNFQQKLTWLKISYTE